MPSTTGGKTLTAWEATSSGSARPRVTDLPGSQCLQHLLDDVPRSTEAFGATLPDTVKAAVGIAAAPSSPAPAIARLFAPPPQQSTRCPPDDPAKNLIAVRGDVVEVRPGAPPGPHRGSAPEVRARLPLPQNHLVAPVDYVEAVGEERKEDVDRRAGSLPGRERLLPA